MREIDLGVCSRFLRVASFGLVLASLHSCGSSSGGSSSTAPTLDDQDVPFVNPVDPQTLQSALRTGVTSDDLTEFWLCSVMDSDRVFAYNLFDNGIGTERDTSTPEVSSEFTWQTTSASVFTTTFIGGQRNISNIQFEGRNEMSLTVSDSLALSCDRQVLVSEPPETPADSNEPIGDNFLSFGGVIYPLREGFESRSIGNLESHKGSFFRLADVPFEQISLTFDINAFPITYWTATGATVRLSAQLYSPGRTGNIGVDGGTFTFEARDTDDLGPEVTGRFFFNDVSFGVDIDNDGTIDRDANEDIEVTGGTISLTRISENGSLVTFDLILANGVSVTGSFENEFLVLR